MRSQFTGLLAATALTTTLVLGATAAQAAPMVIKFSHVVAENTPKGLGAQHFAAADDRRIEVVRDITIYMRRDGQRCRHSRRDCKKLATTDRCVIDSIDHT
jgi:hypothetical protein